MSRALAWRAPRSPLPLLAALLAAYLIVPFGAFLDRLAGTPADRLASPGVGAALAVSAQTATIATAVIGLLGVPLAYLLAHGRSRTSALVGVAIQLPLALPPLMSGLLLLSLVGPYAPAGRLFGGALTDNRVGIVLAQVFVAAPFLVVAARSAFAALDPALEEVAATLGHGRWARFRRVALPAAAPGIGAGLLLAWLRAFGEFGATVVLAYHPYSLPVFTYVQFGSTGLDATMVPVAVAMGAAAAVLLLAAVAPRLHRPAGARPLPRPRPPAPQPAQRLAAEVATHRGGFHLQVALEGRGAHLAVLGASGAGKTLLLRALAGLVPLDGGSVRLGDTDLTRWPAERRGVGYLPQDSCLLPGRTVAEQVGFGVDVEPALAAWWLDRLGLTPLAARLPDQLSGGQRRRVALARALARAPLLLLLDEPFTGLDTPVRDELRRDLRRLQRDTPITTVLVTHDPEDAAQLADEVLLLDEGRVLQAGPYAEVRDRPVSPQAARLLGRRNAHPGTADGRGIRIGGLHLPVSGALPAPGTAVMWSVDPADVRLGPSGGLPATVVDVLDRGGQLDLTVQLDDLELVARAGAAPYAAGDACMVHLPPAAIRCWPAG